jgi:hypothetical protein
LGRDLVPREVEGSRGLGPAIPRQYKRLSHPGLAYLDRCRILAVRENEFFSDLQRTAHRKFAAAHYWVDMNEYMNSGIKRAVSARKALDEADRTSRQADLRAHQRAVKESKQRDLFHLDEIYNPRYPDLRLIPLSDRQNRTKSDQHVFI